ncbi:ABC transporter substrate-binding protein [Paenibacillus sp. CF384]|uniref:AraC family transcriptional regulator n=1 Tax=Paenibacillus sp. CF384 TaxID=1884382 RepID=UPI0008996935|nr:ABC transporter substrate-binding protein [Paenibacillus sp. CF384]SDX55653.1 ABC-type Fe3+-hydroxamate transport system, substrate-binding protein [Paenibacillus sp. CF384]
MKEHHELDEVWMKLKEIEVVKDAQWRIPLNYIDSYLILIVGRGDAQIAVDGAYSSLAAGSAILCLPNQLVYAVVEGEEDSELYILRFDIKVDEGSTKGDFPVNGIVQLSDPVKIVQSCESIVNLWGSGAAIQRFQSQALFHDIVYRLLLDFSRKDQAVKYTLTQTKAYMELHYNRNITIDELADLAGLSRYHYMRSFKRAFGISAIDCLLELRISQSKRLMERTDIRLQEVAERIGYQDEYYFARKFKQKVGIPPASYMKSRKRKIAAYSFPNIGQLLPLRIVPYAAPMDHYWTDIYRRKYESDVVVKLSHHYDFNLNALRQAKPDFIIGIDDFTVEEEQLKLKEIAPTLFVPWTSANWREHMRLAAEFLGNEAEYEAWMEEYERKVIKTTHQLEGLSRNESVLMLQLHQGKIYAYGNRSVASVMYEDLGFMSPLGKDINHSHQELTLQRLAELDADRMLIMMTDSLDPRTSWEELRQVEAWAELRAVRNHNISLLSPYMWFEYSAYTQRKFLDELPGVLKA